MTIDAEVISLDSEIKLKPRMTKSDLRNSVIEYEKKKFFKEIKISTIIKPEELEFTATGSYNEIIQHINCHKYYLNESKTYEIGFEEAVKSWYENLFLPIVNTINDEKLLSRFPGRTNADLYIWIIKHWDDLKRKYGKNIHIKDAVLNYSEEFGKGFKQQFFEFIKKVFFRFFKTNQK